MTDTNETHDIEEMAVPAPEPAVQAPAPTMQAPVPEVKAPRPVRPLLLQVFRQYWRVPVVGVLCGLVIGLGLAIMRKRTYSASSTLLFPSAPMSRLAALTGGGSDDMSSLPLLDGLLMVPQTGSSSTTAIVLLQSRDARLNVIKKAKDYPGEDSVDLESVWKPLNIDEILRKLSDNMVCRIGKQGELYVGFQDENKQVAYSVARAMVDVLSDRTTELGLNSANESIKFLEDRVTNTEKEFYQTQTKMLAFQKQYRIISLPDQAKALAEQYTDLKSQLMAAKVDANIAIRQVNLMANSAGRLIQSCIDPVPGTASNLGALYQQVTTAESELALLKDKFTADHPDVQQKELELKEAQRALKTEISRQLTVLKSGSAPSISAAVVQAAVGQAKASGLEAALAVVQKQVDALPEQEAIYAQLSATLDAQTEALKLFREELEKARIVQQSRGPLYIVVDDAVMPSRPDPAGRLMIILLAMIACFSLSTFIPYARWYQLQMEYERVLEEQTMTA